MKIFIFLEKNYFMILLINLGVMSKRKNHKLVNNKDSGNLFVCKYIIMHPDCIVTQVEQIIFDNLADY